MRQVNHAVACNHAIASTLVRGHLRDNCKLSRSIDSSNYEFRVFGSADVQSVTGRRLIEIIHPITSIDG